ncbi:hypothetical protein, partial [uncultured Nitrospira sp.]|uniref:hypothetical protein n=1 Tax=uncultured Nitrospira sp. TaxID=157176 RepID=UPI003140B927
MRSGPFVDGGKFLGPRRDWFTVQQQARYPNNAYTKSWIAEILQMDIKKNHAILDSSLITHL